MNTSKILELLGTTPAAKLDSLRREEAPVAVEGAAMTANEMLNAELFGTPIPKIRKAAHEQQRGRKVQASRIKHAVEGTEGCPAQEDGEEALPEEAGNTELTPTEVFEQAVKTYYEALKEEQGSEEAGAAVMREEVQDILNNLLPAEEKEEAPADAGEAVAAESKRTAKGSAECVHPVKQAVEMTVETSEGAFPDTFDFDEAAFADEYGIDVETVSCVYTPEDPEAQIAEKVEVSFEYDGSKITLDIASDGTVSETVDAEEVESQFTAEFTVKELEDGTKLDVLVLTLIEDEETKSEGDEPIKSEGDEEHTNEDGGNTTDEFIEEAGLNLDPVYAKDHNLPLADKGAHTIQSTAPGTAHESLAARIIRTRK